MSEAKIATLLDRIRSIQREARRPGDLKLNMGTIDAMCEAILNPDFAEEIGVEPFIQSPANDALATDARLLHIIRCPWCSTTFSYNCPMATERHTSDNAHVCCRHDPSIECCDVARGWKHQAATDPTEATEATKG